MRKFIAIFQDFFHSAEMFLKYQLITKLLLGLALLPLFGAIAQRLMTAGGLPAISNNVLFRFLISPYGVLWLFLGFLLLTLILQIELFGYIAISSISLKRREESSYASLLRFALSQFPRFFNRYGLLVMLFLAVIVPLSGIGLTISVLSSLHIPAFIRDFILDNPVLLGIYVLFLIAIALVSLGMIFLFHFMLIGDMSIKDSMRESLQMVKKNWKDFIPKFFAINLILTLAALLLSAVWFFIPEILLSLFQGSLRRVVFQFLMIFQNLLFAFAALFIAPFESYVLTSFFYRYAAREARLAALAEKAPRLPRKTKSSLLDKALTRKKQLIPIILILLLLIAIPLGLFFSELSENSSSIGICAHRAGGRMACENSLIGLKKAIEAGASWAEVDVQRTLDGYYILHHDQSFSRVAGDPRRATEMTLAEISELRLLSPFADSDETRVPRVEDILDLAKGKISLFLELKGSSADLQMAADLAQMLAERSMLDEAVLVSDKLELISQIEAKLPRLHVGLIYFMAFGKLDSLPGDYIILEASAANAKVIDSIHLAGKMAVVWTVNDADVTTHFLQSRVDIIITDEVKQALQLQKEMKGDERSLMLQFLRP